MTTYTVPPAYIRAFAPGDIGLDVSIQSPGHSIFTHPREWADEPLAQFVQVAPATEFKTFTAALRRFRFACPQTGMWEVDTRRAAKRSLGPNRVEETRDVLAYRPDEAASKAVIIGRIVYRSADADGNSGDLRAEPAASVPGTLGLALDEVVAQATQGMAKAGLYDNDTVQRMLRLAVRRLGGALVGPNRYFVPNTKLTDGTSRCERFIEYANAVERVFRYPVLTVALKPSFDTARALAQALSNTLAQQIEEASSEVAAYIEAREKGERSRRERQWETNTAERLGDLRDSVREALLTLDSLAQTAEASASDLEREAWTTLQTWFTQATDEVDARLDATVASLEGHVAAQPVTGMPSRPAVAEEAAKTAEVLTEEKSEQVENLLAMSPHLRALMGM
jgi:hypothetical protein